MTHNPGYYRRESRAKAKPRVCVCVCVFESKWSRRVHTCFNPAWLVWGRGYLPACRVCHCRDRGAWRCVTLVFSTDNREQVDFLSKWQTHSRCHVSVNRENVFKWSWCSTAAKHKGLMVPLAPDLSGCQSNSWLRRLFERADWNLNQRESHQ